MSGLYTHTDVSFNDWKSTEKDIIIFYNARGESEKNFDIQNNDFGWAHLPFSFLGENMVFMLVTAMLKKILSVSDSGYQQMFQSKNLWAAFLSPGDRPGTHAETLKPCDSSCVVVPYPAPTPILAQPMVCLNTFCNQLFGDMCIYAQYLL